jgi:hypothetical protein
MFQILQNEMFFVFVNFAKENKHLRLCLGSKTLEGDGNGLIWQPNSNIEFTMHSNA